MSDTIQDTPAAPAGDDLRAELSAAWDAAVEREDEPDTGPARDERGRFASESTDTEPDPDQPETKPDETPETPAIAAPQSWSDAEKAEWATLPRAAQDAILRRERDAEQALSDRAKMDPIREVLAPYQEKHARLGLTQAQAVQRLLAYADALETRPDQAFPALMRDFGFDPNRLFSQSSQQAPDPIVEKIQTLEQRLHQLTQAEQQRGTQSLAQTIDAFAADPANPYFDDVRYDMGLLIHAAEIAGKTMSLREAYDKAVWTNDSTRAKVQADADRRKAEAARSTAAAKAEAARKAAGSVRNSSPGRGSPADRPAGTLRDELLRAWSAAEAA